MLYTPDLTNSRTTRRIVKAFVFANSYFKVMEARPCSIKLIAKYFSNPHRGLGRWLLKNLIIEDSGYYHPEQGIAKSYTLNPGIAAWIVDSISSDHFSETAQIEDYNEWVKHSQAHLFTAVTTGNIYDDTRSDISVTEVKIPPLEPSQFNIYTAPRTRFSCTQREFVREKTVELYSDQFSAELATGNFQYRNKKYRYWHELQAVKRDLKKAVLERTGYLFHYDISTAAPTLLLQLAKQQADFPTPVIDALLKHKQLVRNMFSQGLGVEAKDAKQLITSLFYGARLIKDPKRAIMRLVKRPQVIDQLKASRLVKKLRREISEMWKHLDSWFTRTTYTTKTGQVRQKPVTASDKAMVYFQNEQAILKVIRHQLKTKQVKVFCEHDGWSTGSYVDPYELTLAIERATGMRVIIELELSDLLRDQSRQTTALSL